MNKLFLIVLLFLISTSLFAQTSREQWSNLSESKKNSLRQRYKKWKNYSEEKKANLKLKYEKFNSLSSTQKKRISRRWKQMKDLPENKRKELINRIRQLKSTPKSKRTERIRDFNKRVKSDMKQGQGPRGLAPPGGRGGFSPSGGGFRPPPR